MKLQQEKFEQKGYWGLSICWINNQGPIDMSSVCQKSLIKMYKESCIGV